MAIEQFVYLPILPYVLPLDVLYTSWRVDPVAKLDTTKIIIDNPAIDAPNMINVSLVGSTLQNIKIGLLSINSEGFRQN